MKQALLLILFVLQSVASPSPSTVGEGPPARASQRSRFEYVDVYINPGGQSLAAYQFELTADASAAQIVGVEGGEHVAFKPAPYYDPAALQHNRIIIAALNTGKDLPNGKSRIARLHMRVTADDPQFKIQLQTAANSAGQTIAGATIEFERGHQP